MVEEVKKLKDQPGKNMIIYGSGSIVSTLTQAGLIDDCRIFVAPIILGSGKPLFKDIKSKFVLKLVDSRAFTSGLFLLHYLFECN
jgi:dihydrofolate reductase